MISFKFCDVFKFLHLKMKIFESEEPQYFSLYNETTQKRPA